MKLKFCSTDLRIFKHDVAPLTFSRLPFLIVVMTAEVAVAVDVALAADVAVATGVAVAAAACCCC